MTTTFLRTPLLFLFVAAALVAAGCDYGSNEDDSSENEILVSEDLEDRTMSVRETIQINLANHFQADNGLPVQFDMVYDSDVVDAEIEGSQLSLVPVQYGSTRITVRASRPDAELLERSFDLTILCPILPGPTEGNWFPLEEGLQWTFDYSYYSYSDQHAEYPVSEFEWRGTDVWTVTRFVDGCSTAEFEISSAIEGTMERRDVNTGEIQSTEPFTSSSVYEGALNGIDVSLGGFLGSTERTFERIQTIQSDQEWEVIVAESGQTFSLLLEREVGMVVWEYQSIGSGYRFEGSLRRSP